MVAIPAFTFPIQAFTPPRSRCSRLGEIRNQIESMLARKVDERLPVIVERASNVDGVVEGPLAGAILWLMQTFLARSPRSLARSEAAVAGVVSEERELIERMLSRARTSKGRSKIAQLADPRMPSVHARAVLTAVIENDLPDQESWMEGRVVILALDDARPWLHGAGLDEFVTFEEPIVEWAEGEAAPLATFALSPRILAVVTRDEGAIDNLPALALRHCASPLGARQSVICSHELPEDAPYLRWITNRLGSWSSSPSGREGA